MLWKGRREHDKLIWLICVYYTPEWWDCKDSKFIYPAADHHSIISDSRIRYIVSKGPKYKFPSRIDFKKCREEIASALNESEWLLPANW